MFNFFKTNKDLKKHTEFINNIFSLLPEKFSSIKNQINEGIIIGFKKKKLYYIKFYLDTKILNKYEDKKGNFFAIKGIRIFNKKLKKVAEISIDIGYGILIGYRIDDEKDFNPDEIDVRNYYVKNYQNSEFEKIKNIFSKEELELVNPNDVYEVELDGKIYFHLEDIGDGNFIAVDEKKRMFKIIHDPF